MTHHLDIFMSGIKRVNSTQHANRSMNDDAWGNSGFTSFMYVF